MGTDESGGQRPSGPSGLPVIGNTRELAGELGGDPPSVMDLPSLPYIERVVRESMRLYPPVPGIIRQPTADDEIGGYGIPEGATVLLSQWVIHRDPRFYYNPLAPSIALRPEDGLDLRIVPR